VQSGAIRRAQCLTSTLRAALETPTAVGYGGEEGSPSGITLVAGEWQPPPEVTEDDLASARVWLHAYETETGRVASGDCRKWLATFLNNVAKGAVYSERDLDLKIHTLSFAVDDRDGKHFSPDSLKLAWKRFTFIPAARELMQFFDDLEAAERAQAQRLMTIIDGGVRGRGARPGPEDPGFTWSREDAEAHSRRLYEAKAAERREMLREMGLDPIRVPPQGRGESDRDFGIRLSRYAQEICRATEREMNRKRREMMPPPPVPPKPEPAEHAEAADGA
jgi:hypothetical protein